ncbi:DUF1835 domain-containing protein [Pontibacter vulgaris]|uniref:DUF1835 domain-containing protein n=1 Tax=Pontibacter vulgaris TaxID=2905679 RepID=UPI001FA7AFCE|nr:DUF1835 domain-containing protein [Pontibacter vulgaris]
MKKLPSLHILNGDASIPAFKAASLPGEVIVWREVLSEGPAIYTLPEEEFWRKRQEFITSSYNSSAEEYKTKVLDEVKKLKEAHAFFEVILWFDADLMCQVNLLYLLQLLYHQKVRIVSICIPFEDKNISYLKPEQIRELFDNRMQLQPEQLEHTDTLWRLYAGPDPMALQNYLQQHAGSLPLLYNALNLHLKRFPAINTSINHAQMVLLQAIAEGYTPQKALMQQFWKLEHGYGFGDYQLLDLLESLQPELVSTTEPFILTEQGKLVATAKQKYKRWLEHKPWLGGVQLSAHSPWFYDAEKSQLVVQQQV